MTPEEPEAPPVISGLPAFKCPTPDCCMCRGTFADAFSEWVCPHCKGHLGKTRVCLNLCGLPKGSQKRFAAMMNEYHVRYRKAGET